jgi:hypothetical protein
MAESPRKINPLPDAVAWYKPDQAKYGAHLHAIRQSFGNKTVMRNSMPVLIGVACIAIGAVGYWFYQEQNKSGIEVNVGGRGITIETR